jgi:lipopolysaccharide transport system permease protein
MVKLIIQLILFAAIWLYFFAKGASISINTTALLFPLLLLLMDGYGFSFGIII